MQSIIRSTFPLSNVAHALPRDARSYFFFFLNAKCELTQKKKRKDDQMAEAREAQQEPKSTLLLFVSVEGCKFFSGTHLETSLARVPECFWF